MCVWVEYALVHFIPHKYILFFLGPYSLVCNSWRWEKTTLHVIFSNELDSFNPCENDEFLLKPSFFPFESWLLIHSVYFFEENLKCWGWCYEKPNLGANWWSATITAKSYIANTSSWPLVENEPILNGLEDKLYCYTINETT